MSAWINRIVLHNYRRFADYDIEFNKDKNIIVGDNEAGKSSILMAIDLALSGNDAKVKAIGVDSLFQRQATEDFLTRPKEERVLANLPRLTIDLYLADVGSLPNMSNLFGKFRDDMPAAYGLRMLVVPDTELEVELKDYLDTAEGVFPYDFYKVEFLTFGNHHYSGYSKFLRHLTIDNSMDRFDHAERGFVRDAYSLHVSENSERAKLESSYRSHKSTYELNSLKDINDRLTAAENYRFGIRHGVKANLQTDLTIYRNNISIDNLGLGERVFIKTKFSLNNKKTEYGPDVVLIEEPENHLSHSKMNELIGLIKSSQEAQIFIATHSNMISSRLDLRSCIFISGDTDSPVSLKNISENTARFFEKAPVATLLDFVLAKKVILVEGAAEYLLVHKFYCDLHGEPEGDSVYIASVGGLSFKRYMEIAKLLSIKLAILRDNDGDPTKNCIDNYSDHISDTIKVFYDDDASKYTFEVCVYEPNKSVCDTLFSSHTDILKYMLSSKAEAAFLLVETNEAITAPRYIQEAITWIKE